MATFSEIETEVLRIVEDHIDALTTAIVTHVQRAQRAIESRCAFAIQHATVTYQVVPVTTQYAKPDDFVSVRGAPYFLERSTSTKYRRLKERATFEELGLLTEEGVPLYWREEAEEYFQFWPVGDDEGPSGTTAGAYDIVVPYFKRLDELALPSDTNWWSENMDDVLAWRAASFVFAEMRDPMANWWSSVAAARFTEIRNQYKRNKLRARETRIYPTESLSSETQSPRRGPRSWVSEVP